jgi:transcriptional regulator with XRE-family HTH domain
MTEKIKPKKHAAIRCECGGKLRSVKLKNFDFTNWAGVPSNLEAVPGYRCDSCGGETLPGVVVNMLLRVMSLCVIRLPHRLPAEIARFVRRVLQITQQELADRMGIARETVAQWECGEKDISPQHDLILRTLLLERQFGEHFMPPALLTATMTNLAAVKAAPPPKRRAPLQISASEYRQVTKHQLQSPN